MKIYFHTWLHTFKALLKTREYRWSLFLGVAFFIVAYIANYYLTLYTQNVPVIAVGDLILDHIPTVDLRFIFIPGIVITGFIIGLYPIFFKPALLPFATKTIGAFILIRAFFITLTHLGVPANYYQLPQFAEQPGLFKLFYLNDLFFSAHTGLPYLGALLFWENKFMRYLMLTISVVQASTVLLMHVHYSIDVFSAYFITYTIFVVSERIFKDLNSRFKDTAHAIQQTLHKKIGQLRRAIRQAK